jgi:hypothetical protein
MIYLHLPYVFIITVIVITALIIIIIICTPLPAAKMVTGSQGGLRESERGKEVCYIDQSSIDVPGSEGGSRQNAASCRPACLPCWSDAPTCSSNRKRKLALQPGNRLFNGVLIQTELPDCSL